MKQINRSIVVTYNWWRLGDLDIVPQHIKELEQEAEEQIIAHIEQGYKEGELYYSFGDVYRYRGHWNMN